jgi:hypothetical protein
MMVEELPVPFLGVVSNHLLFRHTLDILVHWNKPSISEQHISRKNGQTWYGA